jgi:hypothetical protein
MRQDGVRLAVAVGREVEKLRVGAAGAEPKVKS